MRIIITLFLLIALMGCRKNENYKSSQFDEDTFYFKARLNGEDVHWTVPSHKNESAFMYHAGASFGLTDFSTDCLEGYCYYLSASTQIFKNVADVRPQMNVSFNMTESVSSRDMVLSWFVPGKKAYPSSIRNSTKTDLLNPSKNGIVIYYIDQMGNSWSSNMGAQHGSTFESVLLTDEMRTDVISQKVWKARFSCMLYDNSGHSIKLDNGEIYGPVLLP